MCRTFLLASELESVLVGHRKVLPVQFWHALTRVGSVAKATHWLAGGASSLSSKDAASRGFLKRSCWAVVSLLPFIVGPW